MKAMAKKEDVIEEVLNFYQKYIYVFDYCGINQEKFLRWFNSFDDWRNLDKIYTFFFGTNPKVYTINSLKATVMLISTFLRDLDPNCTAVELMNKWRMMKKLNTKTAVTEKLSKAKVAFVAQWRTRPPMKRHSE